MVPCMRAIFRVVLLIFCLALTPAAQADPGPPPTVAHVSTRPAPGVMYASAYVNLRRTPSTYLPPIRVLPRGQKVTTTGVVRHGWVQVRAPRAGWVYGKYLTAAAPSTYQSRVRSLANQYGCSGQPVQVTSRYGHAGVTALSSGRMYIAPGLSASYLRYVVAHECAHNKQFRAFRGDVPAMIQRLNAIYGGSGLTGVERNADCVTVRLGLSGQHYTRQCAGARGRAADAIAAVRRP